MAVSLATLKARNLARWGKAVVSPGRHDGLEKIARVLIANKERYQRVQTGCGVPWWFVAVVHIREADGSFKAQLSQGDPLGQVSVHVPAGRGPFLDHPGATWSAWERGCFDALIDCAPHAANNPDRSLAGWLLYLELYNGLGYAGMGKPSPYLWSGTDQYVSGKYVRDHDYEADVVDTQPGCAALLKVMLELDPTTMAESFAVTAAKPAAPAVVPDMQPELLSLLKSVVPLVDSMFPTWEPAVVALVTANYGTIAGQALDFVLKAARQVVEQQETTK
jgi:lysozyme family protein